MLAGAALGRHRVAGTVARPGSHRTVRALVAHGSSEQRVMTPAAGRLSTSIHISNANCGEGAATICRCAWACRLTAEISPRFAKYAFLRALSTTGA